MRRALAAALLLAVAAAAASQQPEGSIFAAMAAAHDQLMQGHYLAAVREFEAVAFTPDGKPDDDGFQSWQQYASMLSERRVAVAPRASSLSPADAATLRGVTHTDALAEITRRAKLTTIVFLNEAHSDPQGRAFGLAVARALRPLGYRTLAVETLNNAADDGQPAAMMAALRRDGYVRHHTGVYSNDPAFADFLRQAMALGYRPVAYEQASEATGIEAREQAQADFLVRRAVPHDAQGGKLLVFVGYSHVAENPIAGGQRFFAARVKTMTGIDPLTIDQTTFASDPAGGRSEQAYRIVARQLGTRPGVLVKNGTPFVWGGNAGGVDLQVVRPDLGEVAGRPAWLLGMGRRPSPVPAALLPTTGTRLVQAFLANEAADAVAIDQVLVTAGRPAPSLMLPPGRPVRYATEDNTGTPPLHAARQ